MFVWGVFLNQIPSRELLEIIVRQGKIQFYEFDVSRLNKYQTF